MEITGKLLEAFSTVNVSASFRKREFVVEYSENPQYPEYVKFELIQDKCEMLDSFTIGQQMQIYFNLKGRKWINPKGETVYFNSLQAWKLANVGGEAKKILQKKGGGPAPYDEEPQSMDPHEEEDVPF